VNLACATFLGTLPHHLFVRGQTWWCKYTCKAPLATSLIVFQTPAFGGQSGDQTNSHAGPPLNWGLDQNGDTSHTISVHLINVTTPNNKLNLLIAGYLTLNGRLKSFLMACQLTYISIQQYFNFRKPPIIIRRRLKSPFSWRSECWMPI